MTSHFRGFKLATRDSGFIETKGLEYSLTDHCNLSCYGCDHASPLLPARRASLRDFKRELDALRPVLRSGRLYLLGGEPTLHPDLEGFVRAGSESGLFGGVVLVTNGVLLHKISDSVWQGLSGVHLTRYPGVKLRMSVDDLEAKAARHGVEFRTRSLNGFRVTLLNDPIRDSELTTLVFGACRIAHDYQCHSLYRGRYYRCSTAPYTGQRLRAVGRPAGSFEGDGVQVRDNENLREELQRYLASTEPLRSCTYCLGTSGKVTPHRQLTAAGRAEWAGENHTDPAGLIDPMRILPVRRDLKGNVRG